ncbi:MAG: sulfurtransferase TusA family protein [Alphaproteobacteria bacterium]|nr:sulfurtransferase TusA family protein [Alphaproteobacteria bacterium]
MLEPVDHVLDITRDVCPLTFVKAKLLLERMSSGETARIRLNAGEPLENVPRALAEAGHEVLALAPEAPGSAHYILIAKKSGIALTAPGRNPE